MPNNDLRPEDVALETLLDSASTRLRNILASMDGKETDNVFRPVRCVEKDIENRPSVNGFIYFTTDTKKIYCGVADGEYQIFTVTGLNVTAQNGNLAQGAYIVKVANTIAKVFVK